jgi:hypothetical protein
MCTVSFIGGRSGYALGMNRDEKLSRPAALPVAAHRLNGRVALFPSEPTGGTWIGVNDVGASLALINWYRADARVETEPVSRGDIVRTLLHLDSLGKVTDTLAVLELKRVNPFRLIGVFLAERSVCEWRWNLQQLERIEHHWESSIWISSGFDEAGAQRTRGRAFTSAFQDRSAHNLGWLRQLHRSHLPERGAYSICMHRSDAATVSYSEIAVNHGVAQMRYLAGAPCCQRAFTGCHLPLRN